MYKRHSNDAGKCVMREGHDMGHVVPSLPVALAEQDISIIQKCFRSHTEFLTAAQGETFQLAHVMSVSGALATCIYKE